MEIRKIEEKLDFEVEAQDYCVHNEWRLFVWCSSDCVEGQVWCNSTPSRMALEGILGEVYRDSCYTRNVYGCATLHLF